MELLGILLFSLAVSADGFLVGLAYGFKKIKIPFISLILIACASAGAVTLSMLLGQGITMLIDPQKASMLGGLIIIGIGLYFIMEAYREHLLRQVKNQQDPVLRFNVKPLGIIVHIILEPESADMDASGEISPREAFFLGLALAMDALGAGIGMAMAGYNILLTALGVGLLKFILVNAGLFWGSIFQADKKLSWSSLLTGGIFIIIGLIQIY